MSHAFFSYVREDEDKVREIKSAFERNSISTWFDQDILLPGQNFHDEIRSGIQGGAYYIDIYSKNRAAKERTYANRELNIAVDELILRGNKAGWYIAVTLEDCDVSDRDLGGTMRLGDFHRAQLHKDWDRELAKLLKAVGVSAPIMPKRAALSEDLPASVKIAKGTMKVTSKVPMAPKIEGMVFKLPNGWCRKSEEGHLVAYLESLAPDKGIQRMNEDLEAAKFYMVSPDTKLSSDPKTPNHFAYSRNSVIPKGYNAYNVMTGTEMILPFDVSFSTRVTATGVLDGSRYFGEFHQDVSYQILGQDYPLNIVGDFEIEWLPT